MTCKFYLKSLNPFLFTAWSLLKNFTTLREDYAFRTPSIGRRFNFLTQMAVGEFRNFQKLKLFISLIYFYFFQYREFWRISRNCSRNQPPQKYSISPWVFGFCQIILWKRQKSSHHLCRIFTIPTWLPRRVCSGVYIFLVCIIIIKVSRKRKPLFF